MAVHAEKVVSDFCGAWSKLNVDENPTSAARFAVQAIPTMILFRGPLEIDQIRGALPKEALEARLDRAI